MTDYTFAAGNFGSPMQILIIAVIVLILFGGSRLRNIGGDLGNAIKGFKKAMNDGDKTKEEEQAKLSAESQKIIEGSVEKSAVEKEKVSADKDAK
jgi:sec-independent protein translocase protein TatA